MPTGFVCSVIDVPADRHDPSAGTIPIRILARPHTDDSEPEREPLFASPGGPGAPGIENYAMWLLPGMIGDHRDVVAIDVRGTGPLGAIDCPDLQDGVASYEEWVAAVDVCGAQLGDAADDYGPVDRALDVEAVRQALGYDQIVYHGQSFASVDVQAYAARFPERLAAVVLDSGIGRERPRRHVRSASGWPTGCSTWSPPSAPSTPVAGTRPPIRGPW